MHQNLLIRGKNLRFSSNRKIRLKIKIKEIRIEFLRRKNNIILLLYHPAF